MDLRRRVHLSHAPPLGHRLKLAPDPPCYLRCGVLSPASTLDKPLLDPASGF